MHSGDLHGLQVRYLMQKLSCSSENPDFSTEQVQGNLHSHKDNILRQVLFANSSQKQKQLWVPQNQIAVRTTEAGSPEPQTPSTQTYTGSKWVSEYQTIGLKSPVFSRHTQVYVQMDFRQLHTAPPILLLIKL